MNKSLQVEQMRLLKEFSKEQKVSKQFRSLSRTPRDHPKITSLPPLLRERLTIDEKKNQIKEMMKTMIGMPRKIKKQYTSLVADESYLEKLLHMNPSSSLINAKSKNIKRHKRGDPNARQVVQGINFIKTIDPHAARQETYKMPVEDNNTIGNAVSNAAKWLNAGIRTSDNVSKSMHLQAMKTTHPSIIPEEFEPYSTGRWSYA